jgi:alpha-N-arabinofuranosidase
MKFHNPIIPGFYPDPSICRVGKDYYLATSTFEYFPGVPIFHSRDLVNWRQIGHCLTRASQLNLEKAKPSAGIYAPTLRYHGGLFYMVVMNVSIGRTFIVTATDPAGPWSDPIYVQTGGDPSLFFDDDGKCYLMWAAFVDGSEIRVFQCEIDPASGKTTSAIRDIWAGTGGKWLEAPHLYKINGKYYLLVAEGGTEYGHYVAIARGDSPWGPWLSCPHNPLMRHRDLGMHPIQGTGHADFVEAHDGTWWAVMLAFRPAPVGGWFHQLGRETFLAPVTWTTDGWPMISPKDAGDKRGGIIELEMAAPSLPAHPWPALRGTGVPPVSSSACSEPKECKETHGQDAHATRMNARDDFDAPGLGFEWNYLRNPRGEDYSLSARKGFLRLTGTPVTLDDVDSPTFVGRRQQHFDCRVRTLVEFAPTHAGQEAGLTVLMNNLHHYEIAITGAEESGSARPARQIIVRKRIGDLAAVVAHEPAPDGPIILEIKADREKYEFAFAVGADADKASFKHLASGMTKYLSTEVAGGFTGVYFGIYATSPAEAPAGIADFDWFEYMRNP